VAAKPAAAAAEGGDGGSARDVGVEEEPLRPEEEALARLDDAATSLQKEGRYLEALECMEKGLILRHRLYGGKSAQVCMRL